MISSRFRRDQAWQKSLTTFSLSVAIVRPPPRLGAVGLFMVQVETVVVLVVTEQLREAAPVDDGREHPFRRFARQQHREMLEYDFLGERAILLCAQQPH